MTEQYEPFQGQPHSTDPVVIPSRYEPADPQAPQPLTAPDTWPQAVLDSGPRAVLDVGPRAAPRRRRRAVVLVSSTLAVLLVGAGVAFGARAWTGAGNHEPESSMPASVGAFLRVDLDPGVGDKLAFSHLVAQFPTGGRTATDVITRLEREASTSAGLDYDTDVKSWFGGRAGIAEWTDAAGRPIELIALASKNNSAAGTALAKAQASKGADHFGYAVRNGYALVAVGGKSAQADATAAAAEAAKHALGDASTYRSAVKHLSGHNLILGYVNLHAVAALVPSLGARFPLGGALSGGSFGGGSTGSGWTGSGFAGGFGAGAPGPGASGLGAAGLGATGIGTAGLGAPGFGAPGFGALSGLLGGGAAKLGSVTGTVVFGASVTGSGVEIRVHSDHVSTGATTAGALSGTNARPALDAMPAGTVVGLATDGIAPGSAAAKAVTGAITGLFATRLGGSTSAAPPAILSAVSNIAVKVLTAKVLSVGFAGMTGGRPNLQLNLQAQTDADAKLIADSVTSLGGALPAGVTVTRTGDVVHAAVGAAGAGRLSDSALYKQAMAGMGTANMVAYVNVQQVYQTVGKAADPSMSAQLAPVKAIGVGFTMTGTSSDELVRIVIGK